ncbi:3-deoxy-D-manno-octulosonic acid transferase [Tautonia plasticadhaerens]|uniref:3-deoxy-D-manno-octulosonic acid transferase n=1 Tax=Tautonia plasticadhaerens TaxID=2527974 RepID=A0A518H793_9BACT|nr:3-deoxy-D-manno-octulosonic acid transferase [Tautonia plasticadhaerens]QDV36715.1 3-deoxy-D-manno-octulosonic acid transferase [Tautonia plasticadhaerens]
MPNLLDVAYLGLLLAASPVLFARAWRRSKSRQGLMDKLRGRVPRRIGDAPCLWLHAVSVGEVLLLRPLVAELQRRRPDWDVVVSTTTSTGLEVARRTFPELVTFYAPLDFSWAVRRALERIRPTALVLVETELWPNLIRAASARGARVAVINGRLGRRSHRGYRRFRALLAPTLRRLDAVAAQSQESADRFLDLGVPADRLSVTGSIKYDGLESDRGVPKVREARRALGLEGASGPIFVAGSTMDGEESAALQAYQRAKVDHPGLRLVIVPRHPERGAELARMIEGRGEVVWRRGVEDRPPGGREDGRQAVLLIDTVGELSSIWGLADVAFVGGSLYPGRGGQNVMEPSAFGASVLFGPHTSNFREAVEGLLGRDAARVVRSATELGDALQLELADRDSSRARGASARRFVLAQRGATERTLAALDRLVGRRGRPDRVANPPHRSASRAASSAA